MVTDWRPGKWSKCSPVHASTNWLTASDSRSWGTELKMRLGYGASSYRVVVVPDDQLVVNLPGGSCELFSLLIGLRCSWAKAAVGILTAAGNPNYRYIQDWPVACVPMTEKNSLGHHVQKSRQYPWEHLQNIDVVEPKWLECSIVPWSGAASAAAWNPMPCWQLWADWPGSSENNWSVCDLLSTVFCVSEKRNHRVKQLAYENPMGTVSANKAETLKW